MALLQPKLTQPWLVPFTRWCDENAYLVDCVADNLRTCLASAGATSSVAFDWDGVRSDLRRYLYATGHSRFKRFQQYCKPSFPYDECASV